MSVFELIERGVRMFMSVSDTNVTPNTVYLGRNETSHVRTRLIELPTEVGTILLKVIPVALDSYLQVAYVEDAK